MGESYVAERSAICLLKTVMKVKSIHTYVEREARNPRRDIDGCSVASSSVSISRSRVAT